jgi:hypothetical protein
MRLKNNSRWDGVSGAGLLMMAFVSVALAGSACASPNVEAFPWKDASGQAGAFSQTSKRPKGDEGSFSPEGPSNRYLLRKPMNVRAGQALVVAIKRGAAGGKSLGEIRTDISVSEKNNGSSPVASASFPLLSEEQRLVLPFNASSRIASVSIKATGGSFEIETMSLERALKGIDRRSANLRVSSNFSLTKSQGRSDLSIRFPLAGLESSGSGLEALKPGIFLAYGKAPLGTSLRIEAKLPNGEKRAFSLRCQPSGTATCLDEGLIPAESENVSVSAPKGIEISAFYAAELGPADYSLADLGRILLSETPIANYSLYRWDLIPSVLIFDFKDYATQDRYLKRLAFFTEKIGYRGILMKDEDIASQHGWNAHDYRAQDLAAFFQTAREKSFALDPAEKELEGILESAGVIVESGGSQGKKRLIAAGEGAIISIAKESGDTLRWTLAVHESTHGILFADSDYRAFAQSQWASLDIGERWFWKTYFGWKTYDVGSSYLMGNEFQAYLLQQPISMVEETFEKTRTAELLEKHPELKDQIDAYMAQYGDRFAEHAAKLESWLYEKYGVQAGKTVFLTRSRY